MYTPFCFLCGVISDLQASQEMVDLESPPKPCDYFGIIGDIRTNASMLITMSNMRLKKSATICVPRIVLYKRNPGYGYILEPWLLIHLGSD